MREAVMALRRQGLKTEPAFADETLIGSWSEMPTAGFPLLPRP